MKKFTLNEYLISLLCGILSFTIYWLTAARGIIFSDNGELLSVLTTLGIPHPTGSPFFIMLTGLWNSTVGLVSDSVFSKNLFASFSASLGIAVLHLSLSKLIDQTILDAYNAWFKNIITISMMLMIAFSFSLWNIATYLEIYSIQFCVFSFVILAFIDWSNKPMISKALLVSYLSIFAIATHSSMMFFAFAVNLVLVIHHIIIEKNYPLLLYGFGVALLAGSIYMLPIIRSQSEVPFNWGEISRSYDAFTYHITGKQFQVWMFESKEVFVTNSINFGKELFTSTLGIGVLFSICSVWILWKNNRYLVALFGFYLLFALPFIFSYGIPDIQTYFVIPIVFTSFLGIVIVLKWCVRYQWLALICMMLPCISVGSFWNDVEQQNNTLVEDYVSMMTEQLPQNSLLISSQWDNFCSAFWYKQKIQGYRTDIVLIEKELLRRTWYPRMVQRWYPEVYKKSQKEFENYVSYLALFENGKPFEASKLQRLYIVLLRSLIENAGSRVAFCTPEILQSDPSISEGYVKIPQGLVVQIAKKEIDTTFSVKKLNPKSFFTAPVRKSHYYESSIHRTFMISMGYTSSYLLSNNKLEEGIRAKDLSITSSLILQKLK